MIVVVKRRVHRQCRHGRGLWKCLGAVAYLTHLQLLPVWIGDSNPVIRLRR